MKPTISCLWEALTPYGVVKINLWNSLSDVHFSHYREKIVIVKKFGISGCKKDSNDWD